MTSRGLSAWSAIAFGLLAILVAVDRPHWFGLQSGAATVVPAGAAATAVVQPRSAPWLIRQTGTPTR